jgi:hypothetical protein
VPPGTSPVVLVSAVSAALVSVVLPELGLGDPDSPVAPEAGALVMMTRLTHRAGGYQSLLILVQEVPGNRVSGGGH